MKKFMQTLSAGEAAGVLQNLLDSDPAIIEKAYDAAMRVIGNVDVNAIMNNVYSRLNRLDLDDLSGRAGRTRYGYVEPDEAAWEMFEEALDPFIDEMKKNQKRALPAVAKAHCIGIVKGLQMYGEGSSSEFSDWVEDAPGEYIDSVIEEWKKGKPSEEDIAEVMSIERGDCL
jgi:hypothetical protein